MADKWVLETDEDDVKLALPDDSSVRYRNAGGKLWMFVFPEEALLTPAMARQLAAALTHWADCGELPSSDV